LNQNWFERGLVKPLFESLAVRYRTLACYPRHTREQSAGIYACQKFWTDSQIADDLSHRAHIYKYTIPQLRYNHVITMSYLKCCCVLMWYYVFAIKIKYNGRKKVRHITIHLCCSYGSHIWPVIIIQYFQKVPFYHILYRIKKRDLKKISVSSLITCVTCVLVLLILFSLVFKISL